jgi:AcrR family transcriptional regulator
MGITERKEREKAQRRESIIDAAEKVFFKKGIENATMDEVAENAELSKGTLYLYFKSKEELHFAIRIRAAMTLKEYFVKAIDPKEIGSQNVYNIGRAYVRFSMEHQDYFNSMAYFEHSDFNPSDSENPFFKNFREETDPLEFFIGIIDKGITDGSVRKDIDPNIMAKNLWAATTGMLLHVSKNISSTECIQNEKDLSPELFIESYFKIISSGIQNED